MTSHRLLIIAGLAALSTIGVLVPALAQETPGALLAAIDEGTGAAAVTDPPEAPVDVVSEANRPLPTVDEVMDRLNDLWRSESSRAQMTMTVVTQHFERTLSLDAWTQGEDYALIIIRSPAREAGTATLKTPEGLWNYAPRADRLMRIPSGLLSESWMGSHFSNEDIMRDSSYVDDYDTELSWVERDGTTRLLAVSIPHPTTPIAYSRIDFLMDADTWVPIRADYYDDDEIVRRMSFSNVREMPGGRFVPMTMELLPLTDPGEVTRVSYDELELDADVSSSLFTQRGLRREAQR